MERKRKIEKTMNLLIKAIKQKELNKHDERICPNNKGYIVCDDTTILA